MSWQEKNKYKDVEGDLIRKLNGNQTKLKRNKLSYYMRHKSCLRMAQFSVSQLPDLEGILFLKSWSPDRQIKSIFYIKKNNKAQ